MRKRVFSSLLASFVLGQGAIIAQSTAQDALQIHITDFMKGTTTQGSLVIRPEESADLYDQDGRLLETLKFYSKRRNFAANDTASVFIGKEYQAVVYEKERGFNQVVSRKTPPVDRSNYPKLSKREAIELATQAAQASKRVGDQIGYEEALKGLERAKALPDD